MPAGKTKPKKRDIKKLVGRQVAAYRKTAGVTQEQLAEKVGVDPVTISRMERGVSLTSVEKLDEIAGALGIKLRELVDFEGPASAEGDLAGIVRVLKRRPQRDVELIRDITTRIMERLGKAPA